MEDTFAAIPPPSLVQVVGGVPDHETAIRPLPPPYRLRLPGQWLIDGQYTTWEGVRWGINFHSVEQAEQFRTDLDGWIREWVATKQADAAAAPTE